MSVERVGIKLYVGGSLNGLFSQSGNSPMTSVTQSHLGFGSYKSNECKVLV